MVQNKLVVFYVEDLEASTTTCNKVKNGVFIERMVMVSGVFTVKMTTKSGN